MAYCNVSNSRQLSANSNDEISSWDSCDSLDSLFTSDTLPSSPPGSPASDCSTGATTCTEDSMETLTISESSSYCSLTEIDSDSSTWSEENEQSSRTVTWVKAYIPRNYSDVQSKFDPQINFDFVPECCQPEPSERAQTCAVEGSRFCLGSLSVADHCSEFGGGPGVDRQDGPTGPIIFCGVGTRYKRPPVEVVEPDAVETEQPEAVGAPLPIISDSTLPDTVKFGASIYFHIILKLKLVNCALGSVLAALKTVEAPMLPFVTAAGDRFTDIYEKFSDSKPSLAVQYLDTEKAFPVFDFDAKDFIGCLKLPIGEDVDAILKMLTEFTSLVEHLYACFADHDYININ